MSKTAALDRASPAEGLFGEDHWLARACAQHVLIDNADAAQPPLDPAMMTALLLYGYCHGVTRRRIAKAAERVDFMSIVGLDPPDFRTVSDFRKRHLKALAGLLGKFSSCANRRDL